MTTEAATLQKALDTIKKLKGLLIDNQRKIDPIAIVGLSCRFPQAKNKHEFWELLLNAKNTISHLPEERWDLLKNTDEMVSRVPNHPYWGAYLTDITQFDAYFFGISPREALRMDPQQRLLLEVTYEAFEDAGLTIEELAGSNTGVFSSLYGSQLGYLQDISNDMDALYIPTGNAISIAANRLSYLFDLRGPSIVLDTACSSSLVALHLACLHLQNNLCETAIVSGANLNLIPSMNALLSKAQMLSPNGQCHTFDASANGYVQGEGIGVVVLKPLSQALKNNDRMYAVIAGSAVNQDGKTNGLTAPNGLQQEKLIKDLCQSANVSTEEIAYVECHGTGTFLGDPIEIQALGLAIGKNRPHGNPCWIGSVKTNIGHLEPAAGIASVIKTALAIYNEKIPPHVNFSQPNPHIAFDKYQLQVPLKVESWGKYAKQKLAGISGFGFGGTNAHVILKEAPKTDESTAPTIGAEIFLLSAKDQLALNELIQQWLIKLDDSSIHDLGAICYNLQRKRAHYHCRLAIITSSLTELQSFLVDALARTHNDNIYYSDLKTHLAIKQIDDIDKLDNRTLAKNYVEQAAINWKVYQPHRNYTHIDLPMYPWQHKSYWPPLINKVEQTSLTSLHPLKGRQIVSPIVQQFEFSFDTATLPEILDTYNVLHAGYYLEMLIFAVKKISGQTACTIHHLTFLSALFVPAEKTVNVFLTLEIVSKDHYAFNFYSQVQASDQWIKHASGSVELTIKPIENFPSLKTLQQNNHTSESVENLYERVTSMGMPAGDSIRWTESYHYSKNQILCQFREPESCKKRQGFTLGVHPGIIDGCIQPIFKLLPAELMNPYMAKSFDKISFFGLTEDSIYLLMNIDEITVGGKQVTGSAYLLNQSSEVLIEFSHLKLTQLENTISLNGLMNNKKNIDLLKLSSGELRQYALEFLIQQAATLFSMPEQDINASVTLRDMGIDSLMALVFSRAIEVGLNTTFSSTELLNDITLNDLADYVVNKQYPTQLAISNKWFHHQHSVNKEKTLLFCFPYGGGGASIFRDWQRQLSNNIEVYAIQPPAREERLDELPIKDMQSLVLNVIEQIHSTLDRPFAFFGHSLGAWMAFEVARVLQQKPTHLFLSAAPDPRLPKRSLDAILEQLSAVNIDLLNLHAEHIQNLTQADLSNLASIFQKNGIAEYGAHLLNRDVITTLLPTFIADMNLVKSYSCANSDPVSIPMTVFAGKQDAWVTYQEQASWKDLTSQVFKMHEVDGPHLFIRDKILLQEILGVIKRELMPEKAEVI